jgi:hypothetical protein
MPLMQNCTAASVPTATPDPWTAPPVAIEVFSPITDSVYHSPIEVIGFSQTFEGNVVVRLRDATNTVIAERATIGGSVDGHDFFHTRLRFYTEEQQDGTIEVFETSAADGSEIHKVTIPVILLPGQRVLDLDAPAVGQAVCAPVIVSGYSNTFEANVVTELYERSGTLITTTITMGGNLGFFENFSAVLEHEVEEPAPVLVAAYGGEGQGLGPWDHTRVPVSLYSCPQ